MIIRNIDPEQPDPAALAEALALLRAGGLVVIPTDTVYGLAADISLPAAMDKLFEAKGRPKEKPIAMLAADPTQIAAFGAAWPEAARKLARRYWPGALTLVLASPHGRLGFRIPAHNATLALLRMAGTVLAVTSANASGAPAARTADEAVKALGPYIELALDAGPSPGGVASTVVRIDDDQIEILREGAIAKIDILATAGAPS
jgi:L-threonylcarbamoyladenylate synthase